MTGRMMRSLDMDESRDIRKLEAREKIQPVGEEAFPMQFAVFRWK